jgi:hypothetical protein
MWCSEPAFILTLLGWVAVVPPIAFALGWWTHKTLRSGVLDETTRRSIDFLDGRSLEVVVTSEGVIFDAYVGDTLIGTCGMTFDEWHFDIGGESAQ